MRAKTSPTKGHIALKSRENWTLTSDMEGGLRVEVGVYLDDNVAFNEQEANRGSCFVDYAK